MKTYPFTFGNVPFKLTGLTTDVKEEWMDPVRYRLMARAKRMYAKGLTSASEFAEQYKSAQQAGFHCPAAGEEISTPEGRKRLIALMLIPQDAATPEFVDALYEESKNLKSSLSLALDLIKADAFPDPPAEPTKDETEGEESDPKAGTPKS
jgi:hypothetical protein